MKKHLTWSILFLTTLLFVSVSFALHVDLLRLDWVEKLSREGSPEPARSPEADSGYTNSQHHFLGKYERGATYRWISETQNLINHGITAPRLYKADSPTEGRPCMLPRIEGLWVASVSCLLHAITGEPLTVSVERAALWEPFISHLLALFTVFIFMLRRHGYPATCLGTAFFAVFPAFAAQFLPGDLSSRTWALLLAGYALALLLDSRADEKESHIFSLRLALVTSLTLWLEPGIGVAVLLISALVGARMVSAVRIQKGILAWCISGSSLILIASILDHIPWKTEVSELRYVHPLYALLWVGLGLGLDGFQRIRTSKRHPMVWVALSIAALSLSGFVYAHLHAQVSGFLHPNAALNRVSSVEEAAVYTSIFDWWSQASPLETLVVSFPPAIGLILIGARLLSSKSKASGRDPWSPAHVVFLSVALLSCFYVRWLVVLALLVLPLAATFAAHIAEAGRRTLGILSALFILGIGSWNWMLPPSLDAPTKDKPPSATDLDYLVYRQFSHWLSGHSPGAKVVALAPPELSDCLVFHGGVSTLTSTAWESFPGKIAASRILSAPEYSEAEAVVTGQALTHLIIPTWDNVLPLLVRAPDLAEKEPLYARLRRWVFPPFLRPVPYHLPAAPGYDGKWLLVYKVTPSQDEALALARLAEYYLEMGREDLADLVVKVLKESYRDEPNAVLARAAVYHNERKGADFTQEFEKVCTDLTQGTVELSWDRRVQRAIILALGRRPELARKELEDCVASATPSDILDLSPLQAFRLRSLLTKMLLKFPEPAFDATLMKLSSEFSAPPPAAK